MEYHGFGIISEGVASNTHYIIAGVQGDWTRGLVSDPPKTLWTREMKVRLLALPLAAIRFSPLTVFTVRWSALPRALLSPWNCHLHGIGYWSCALYHRATGQLVLDLDRF